MKDISKLADDLEKMLKEQFKQDAPELGERVKATMQYNIVTEVYDAYPDPKVYQRTYKLLQDVQVSDVQEQSDSLTIDIYAERKDDDKDIAKLVEEGHNISGYRYDFPTDERFTDPRPFMKSTMEVMEDEIKRSLDRKTIKQVIDKLNK